MNDQDKQEKVTDRENIEQKLRVLMQNSEIESMKVPWI